MKTATLALMLMLGAPAVMGAQQATEVRTGESYPGSIDGDERNYTIMLAADQFVYGEVLQKSVDVVVKVSAPDGHSLGDFDTSGASAESFQFASSQAGVYTISLAGFEGASGSFVLQVKRVEPVAPSLEGRVDQVMAQYTGTDRAGAVVTVVRDGRTVLSRGYGMADLEHTVPNDAALRYNIGSVSKQFTAFAIALLAERGHLSLDDDIRRFFPEFQNLGDTVRVRHLVSHTSGLREFLNLLAIGGRSLEAGDGIDHDEAIRIVQRQTELQSKPGSVFLYNNTGYSLLAEIIERVTQTDFNVWMQENVFRPVGMTQTVIVMRPGQVIPNRAGGHSRSKAGYRRVTDLGGSWGPGGIYSTAGDLALWLENMRTRRVGSARVHELMTTRFVLNSGDTTDYALGLTIDEHRGLRRVQHGGNDMGHAAMLAWYPEYDTGVIVLSNVAGGHATRIANLVAEAVLEEHMRPETEARPAAAVAADSTVTLPRTVLDRYAGDYRLEAGPQVRFFRDGSTLFTQISGQPRFEMSALNDTLFRVEVPGVDARVAFHPVGSAAPTTATLFQAGREFAVRRAEPWAPTAEELASYAGTYYSAEVLSVYELTVEDGTLTAHHARYGEVPMKPMQKDSFGSDELGLQAVTFVRDDDGKVMAFLVSNGRTRGVRFERVFAQPGR